MSNPRQRLRTMAFLVFAIVTGAVSAQEPSAPPLKKGDRIVFLGDSITQAGVGAKGYVTFIKNRLQEKYAALDLTVVGAGISGNKVPDLQKRLERDVLSEKPTIVVIYIGINDVWHGEKNPAKGTSKEQFESGLKDVIGRIKNAGARVILCTPSVIGEKVDGGNNLDAKLDAYAAISRTVAKDAQVQLCDLRQAFVDYLKKHNPDNKASGILTSDRVHLNPAGNELVAGVIMKSLEGR